MARARGWPSRSELAYALTVRLVAAGWPRAELAEHLRTGRIGRPTTSLSEDVPAAPGRYR
jgi:hypothetical protein